MITGSLRIDAQGNKLWDKTYGGTSGDVLYSMVAAPDGGFLLGGYSASDAGFEKSEDERGRRDYWVARIDAQGNKLWDKTYGGTGIDEFTSIVATPDGGFLLGGWSFSDAGFEKSEDARGNTDYWVARIDAQGAKLWDKTYGGTSNDLLHSIVAAADGGFLLGGYSESRRGLREVGRRARRLRLLGCKNIRLDEFEGLQGVSPQTLAAPGPGTIDLYGNPFNENSTVTLFREGQTLAPERVYVAFPIQSAMPVRLRRRRPGRLERRRNVQRHACGHAVRRADRRRIGAVRALRADCGSRKYAPERWNTYHFAVSNTSNGDRQGVPVWIALPDTGAEVRVSFRVAEGNPLDTAWQDLNIHWPFLPDAIAENPDVLPLYLPYLPAGKTISLRVRVKANFGNENFNLKAWTNSLMSGDDFERLGQNCLYVALTAVGAEAVPDVVSEIGTLEEWRQCAAQAAIDVQRDLRLLGFGLAQAAANVRHDAAAVLFRGGAKDFRLHELYARRAAAGQPRRRRERHAELRQPRRQNKTDQIRALRHVGPAHRPGELPLF